jgi:hypothetical protein
MIMKERVMKPSPKPKKPKVVRDKQDKQDKSLLPVSEYTYDQILDNIRQSWEITTPSDELIAKRMVSVWMRLHHTEQELAKYGMYLVGTDSKGNPKIQINQMSNHLNQLDAELRSYFRLLNQKMKANESKTPSDFKEWLDMNAKPTESDQNDQE